MENEELENLKIEAGIGNEEIEQLKEDSPQSPSFPFLIFIVAAAKDVIDWIDGGILIGALVNIIAIPILFLYMRGKMGFVKKRMYRRFVFSSIIGFIPIANAIIPEWSIFVVVSWLKEHEQIGKVLNIIESSV